MSFFRYQINLLRSKTHLNICAVTVKTAAFWLKMPPSSDLATNNSTVNESDAYLISVQAPLLIVGSCLLIARSKKDDSQQVIERRSWGFPQLPYFCICLANVMGTIQKVKKKKNTCSKELQFLGTCDNPYRMIFSHAKLALSSGLLWKEKCLCYYLQ